MLFLKASAKGFKKWKDPIEFNFKEGLNVVLADNNGGKTSIAELINYIVAGRDLSGSVTVDHLINEHCNMMEGLLFFVDDNGEVHTLIRSREIVKGKTTSKLFLDDTEKTAADLVQYFGDPAVFMATWYPTMIHGLDDDKAKDLLEKFIQSVPADLILSALDPHHQEALQCYKDPNGGLRLHDPAGLAKEARKELKDNSPTIANLTGQISVHQKTADQVIPEEVKIPTPEEIASLRKVLADLNDPAKKPIPLAPLQERYQELSQTYKTMIGNLKKAPEAGTPCPLCAQAMTSSALAAATVEINEHNEKTKVGINSIVGKAQAVVKEIEDAKKHNAEIKSADPEAIAAAQLALDIALSEQMTGTQSNTTRANAIKQRDYALAEVMKLQKKIADIKADGPALTARIEALMAFMVEREQRRLRQITDHVDPRVGLKLTKVVKDTGEIKPDFAVLFDGQPKETMSNSNRTRAAVALSNMFRKLSGINYPTYIDNWEAVTDLQVAAPDAAQYFTAEVTSNPVFAALTINPPPEPSLQEQALAAMGIDPEHVLGQDMFGPELPSGPTMTEKPIDRHQEARDLIARADAVIEAAKSDPESTTYEGTNPTTEKWPAGTTLNAKENDLLLQRHEDRSRFPDLGSDAGVYGASADVKTITLDVLDYMADNGFPEFPPDDFPGLPGNPPTLCLYGGILSADGCESCEHFSTKNAGVICLKDPMAKDKMNTPDKKSKTTKQEAQAALDRFDEVRDKAAAQLLASKLTDVEKDQKEIVAEIMAQDPADRQNIILDVAQARKTIGPEQGESILQYHRRMTAKL